MIHTNNRGRGSFFFCLLLGILISYDFMFSSTYNPAHAQDPNIIIDTRYDLENNRMRFVIESTKRPNYNIITLENPNRLVIDLKNTQKQKRSPIHFNSDMLAKIRFGIRKKTDLRIVLDLKTQYMHRTLLLEPSSNNKRSYRLVTDIFIQSGTKKPEQPIVKTIEPTPKTVDQAHTQAKAPTPTEMVTDTKLPPIPKRKNTNSIPVKIQETVSPKQEPQQTVQFLPLPPKSEPIEDIPIPEMRQRNTESITQKQVHSSAESPSPVSIMSVAIATLNQKKPEREKTTPKTQQTKRINDAIIASTSITSQQRPNPYQLPPPVSSSNKLFIEPSVTPQSKPKPPKVAKPAKKISKPHIIVDAGHGGRDPGAIGKGRKYEKDITLKYAKSLKKALEKEGKYRVTLTRKGDYYVGLHERVRKARKADGDVFISLHADSHPRSTVRGLSVYTLSETASDKEAARLARRENKESIIDGINPKSEEFQITDILIDLIQRDTKNKSSILAEKIIEQLSGEVRILKNAHRFAGFRVLTSHDIPSVLVELGYLSNKKDARNLTSKGYQRKIIISIERALDAYFTKTKQNVKATS